MANVFKPEEKSLDGIFTAHSTYVIPAYQRPYSWEAVGRSDRDGQVIQMWNDLWEFFGDNRATNAEYFFGSMVAISDPGRLRTFQVIDGQQRLTTLLLLFAAMRCFLAEARGQRDASSPGAAALDRWFDRANQTLEEFLYNQEGLGLMPQLKVKIERSVGTNFNQILEQAVACSGDGQVAKLEQKYRDIAQRYFQNRDYFMERLREAFLPAGGGALGEAEILRFDEFFKFLRARVTVVLITTIDFATAYRIFEILNNRGLPLSNLDLLRNFVLEALDAAKIPSPDERWARLEREYVFTEEFIGRWTESVNAAQPRSSAFNDAKKLYEEHYADTVGKRRIEVFCEDLERNLGWYNLIAEPDQSIDDPAIRNAVRFINLLGNERYSANLMLAMFRALGYDGRRNEEVLRLLRTYRSRALHTYLLGRLSSARIYDAIRALNRNEVEQARSLFRLEDQARRNLQEVFDAPWLSNDQGKLLLAACIWDEEEQADDVVTEHLDWERCTLEHIIPQDPAPGSDWLTDFPPEFRRDFTYRIGNMTLLTRSRNSANRNFGFDRKRTIYAKMRLPMTVKLAAEEKLTEEYLRARQKEIVARLEAIFLNPAWT